MNNDNFWQSLNRQPNELKVGDILICKKGIPFGVFDFSIDELQDMLDKGYFKEFIPREARLELPL